MRVLYLTMNPNRESTTVPTEGWFRLLKERGLEPVLVSNRSGSFQAWAKEQGVPCYEVPLPFPNSRRPWAFLRSLAGLTAAAPTPYSVAWHLTPELWLALAAGAIGSTPWMPALAARLDTGRSSSLPLLNTAALMALLVLSIMSMAARTYNPFIYFRF